MKVAICTMIKDDNLYLRDWILYHQFIGVDNIILYDNNDINGEDIFPAIGDLIDNGVVLYNNIRGITKKSVDIDIEFLKKALQKDDENEIRNMLAQVTMQIKYFQEAFDNHKEEYDWIGFFDVDEYLTITKGQNIKEYLQMMNNVDELFFNWKNYGDNNKIHYEAKPLNERFTDNVEPLNFKTTYGDDFLNMITKCMVHCKSDTYDSKFMASNHYMILFKENPFYANNVGQRISIRKDQAFYRILYNYDAVYLKHFYTKTIYEFLYKKQKFNKNSNDYDVMNHIQRFFDFNVCTQEKIEIVQKYLNRIEKPHLIEPFKNFIIKDTNK